MHSADPSLLTQLKTFPQGQDESADLFALRPVGRRHDRPVLAVLGLIVDGPMIEAAMATSAAPTYFPTHKMPSDTPIIDGGLWANNPAGIAAVEAVGVLRWSPDETKLLTATPLTTDVAHKRSLGRLYWARKLLEVVGAGRSSGAIGTALLLLGHDNVIRIEPVVAPGTLEIG